MNVLTFTTLWPNAEQPNFGVFVKHRVAALAKLDGVNVRVVAPVPYFPNTNWEVYRRGVENTELAQSVRAKLRASCANLCASAVEKTLNKLILESTRNRWQQLARVPEWEQIADLPTLHPRYLVTPKIGMSFYGDWMARGAWKVVQQLHAETPFDLIDAHYVYPDGYAATLIGKRLNIPVFVTARGTDINLFSQMPLIRPKIVSTLNRADGVIAVSEALKQRMVELGIVAEKIAVIRNGIDHSIFHPRDRNEARRRLNLDPEDCVLLTVAALVPLKGIDQLIEAVALLQKREPNRRWKLLVIGEGPERRALESQISNLKLQNQVQLVGAKPQDELADWYSAADLFCLASDREGCPNVILEALACGVPVVASNVGGVAELVRSQVCGQLISQPSAENFAAGIQTALTSVWNREEIADASAARSWDKVASEVRQFFTALGNFARNEKSD